MVSGCGDSGGLGLPCRPPGRGPPRPQLEAYQPLALFFLSKQVPLGSHEPCAQLVLVWGGVRPPPLLTPVPVRRLPVCSGEMGTGTGVHR